MTIKHIVLSGGGYKGFYSIGALKYLAENNFYDIENIENIYGTSVGTIIGAALCLKLNLSDICEYVINKPWHKDFNFKIESLLDVYSKKGIINKSFIVSIFDNLLKSENLKQNITLKELYDKCNINFYIFVVNFTTYELVKLSHKTHPDLELLEAIYMSCSLPFIFQPAYYNNECYIDGGVINPYPLNVCIADLKKINPNINKKEILGIEIASDNLKPCSEDSSIIYFFYYTIRTLIQKNWGYKIKDKIPYEVYIPAKQYCAEDVKKVILSKEEIKNIVYQGETYGKLFFLYQSKEQNL